MRIARFLREVVGAPYYRKRPLEALQFAYAKWLFSRFRLHDPVEFLRWLAIDTDIALDGFQKWLPTLREVFSKVRPHQGHQGGISMEDGTILYGLTRALKPETVIETGVAAGVSTSFIGAALIENGYGALYSLELPPEDSAARVHLDGAAFDWPDSGVGWAIPEVIQHGMGSRHTLVLQDVRIALPTLLWHLQYIDLFFHDDLHTPDHMFWEFELVWPHIRPNGLLISDDVNFGWVQFCHKHKLGKQALYNIQRLTAIRKHAVSP